MKTMLRWSLMLTVACSLGSVAALIAGVGSADERLPLRFDPDPFVIPAGMNRLDERDFQVAVINDADEPARIVGVEEFCSSACFYGKELPTTIPPRGRGRVTLRIKARVSGKVSEQVGFFTDRPSQPKLTLRVEGNIREEATHEATTQARHP